MHPDVPPPSGTDLRGEGRPPPSDCPSLLGVGTHTDVDALAVAVQAGEPLLVWGRPGVGKSARVEAVAAALERPCITVIGSLREASDFAGLPIRTEDGVRFAPPTWALAAAAEPNTVLFLDELTSAPPGVQAAMLRLVLDRRIGDLALPDGVAIVAAANPPDLAADGFDLSAPLANRFCHLHWEADVATWVAGMTEGWPAVEVSALPTTWSHGVPRVAGLDRLVHPGSPGAAVRPSR